ncbi:MAG TPA: FHA domain-containing protein [Kofleriaceae bacterium]|nr:FHA domain-containing protein [Kofleriaceae bacterium]
MTAPPLSRPPPPPQFHSREDFDHQSTVDPSQPRESTVDLELSVDAIIETPRPGMRSVSAEARPAEDSGQILLEQSRGGDLVTPVVQPNVNNRIAAGTGETDGTIDEPTMAEDDLREPQLAVVRAPPAHPPPAPGRPGPGGSRMGSGGDSVPGTAWLTVQAGTDRGRRFQVKTGGRTTIGRGIDNDVVLTDIAVSRRHLYIDGDPQGYVMTDLGSGNGTLVNDRDQDGIYRLGHGDRLELGNTVLVFECQELAARPAVPAAPRSPAGPAPGKQKWARQHDDDDQSTVAGKKPAGLRMTSPMPAPRPPAAQPTMLEGPAARRSTTAPPPGRRAPTVPPPLPPGRRTSTGGSVEPPPAMLSMPPTPSVPHNALPTRDPQPMMPVAGAHMPTMAADVLGLGGLTHATPQPPMHQMPPMGSGFSPFPGAGLSYPSPPAGFGIGGPTPHPPPRFQYPQGVMSPSPGSERKRVLIGILAIAFVAVGAGIVMALVHGRGGDKTADKAATTAPAPGPTPAPAPSVTPAPAPSVTPAPTPPEPVVTSGAPDSKVTLASLMGEKNLTPDSFGNDEQFLSDATGGGGTAPVESPPEPPAPKEAPRQPEKRTEKRTPERPARTAPARREPDEDEEEEEEVEEDSGGGDDVDVDGAMEKAEKQYKSKQFADAVATLRRAADGGAGKKEAQRLRALAAKYETVGSSLRQGGDDSDPPKALAALKKAHSTDADLDGVLDSYIGVKIGQIAPKAAGSYMARSKYAEAKLAADDAATYGNGAAVSAVRSRLEREATALYDRANAAANDGDDAKAADLARQAMKLVPKSSSVYTRAQKLAGKK